MRHPVRLSSLAVPIWLSAAAAWPGVANGAWELVPSLSLEAEANDNPRLLPDTEENAALTADPASRLLAEASVLMTNYGQRGEIFVEPTVRTDGYADPEHEDLQSTDFFLGTGGRYRSERTLTGFDADFSREKILGTEFLAAQQVDPDFDDLTVTDTVLLAQNERRNRVLLSPFVEIESSASGTVRLDGRFMDVRYDDSPLTFRSDFRDLSLGAEYIHRLDTRSTVSGRIEGAAFEADANQNRTNTAGLEVGFSRDLSDVWSIDLALGAIRSELDYLDESSAPVTGTDDNFTFSVGLRKRAELSRLALDLQRRVSPDSFGFLVARNQLRVAYSQRLSQSVSGIVAVRAIQTESIHDQLREDRAYGRIQLGIDWAFGELWSLTADYAYSSRDVVSSNFDAGDASSNTVSIRLNYRGRERPR